MAADRDPFVHKLSTALGLLGKRQTPLSDDRLHGPPASQFQG